MVVSDTKPLMSEAHQDPQLPVYRLDESNEELIVGAPKRGPRAWIHRMRERCAERRAQRAANGGGCCRHSCAGRLIKWLFALGLIFVAARWFIMHHLYTTHRATCVPVNETTTAITLPYASERTRIFLHPSITTGDSHIVRSDTVTNGTINISFELPSATDLTYEDTPEELFVCTIAKPRGVGIGLFTRGHGAPVPAVRSATVKLSPDVHSPKVIFVGPEKGCMRRGLRKHIVESAIARYDAGRVKEDWVIVD